MKPGGGKTKGAAFERRVCVDLSLWISGGEREDLLWRSAMSGGRATRAYKRGKSLKQQLGDVSAVSSEGCVLTDKFMVECKHIKNLSFQSFAFSATGDLASFWVKLCLEAARHKKYPLLIAKQNRLPVFALTYPGVWKYEPNISFGSPVHTQLHMYSTLLAQPFDVKKLK